LYRAGDWVALVECDPTIEMKAEDERERVVVSEPPSKDVRASINACGRAFVCFVSCLFGVVCVQLFLMCISPSLVKNHEFVVVLVCASMFALGTILCGAALGCCVEECE